MITLEEVESRHVWEGLCPGLSICDGETYQPQESLLAPAPEALSAGLQRLRRDGYVQLPPLLPSTEMKALAAAVEVIQERFGVPLFALVYDALWALPWRLSGVLSEILGGDVRLLPDCWVWRVETAEGASGWSPHRDRDHGTVDDDGTPQIISLWLPLTDATPDNGCIYVLPASQDPHYHNANPEGCSTIQQLQHIRALPAAAGAVLCWTHQLLHWGGSSSAFAPHPRISVAFEVQRSSAAAFSKPLFALDELPGFHQRLGLIGRMLLQYEKMQPLSHELRKVAKGLRRHMPGKRSFKRSFADVLASFGGRS